MRLNGTISSEQGNPRQNQLQPSLATWACILWAENKKIPIHIFQKLVGKEFSVTEKTSAMATTQIRSLTHLDTMVHLIFSFLFANTDVPCIYQF